MTSEKRAQKFHTDDAVVTRHQYGISALVSQTSFHGETIGGLAKCRLFSQAIKHQATIVFFPYTAWLKTFVPYRDSGYFMKDSAGNFQG